MWSKWECTDNDCCQYMRQNDNLFEMIQAVWLDTTEEDLEEGNFPYIVVREVIDLDDYSKEEIEEYLISHAFTLEGQSDWMKAECILEDVILRNWCIVAEFYTPKDAEKYIKGVVNK